jgi:uncharacterized membrane protein (UPF0127 family)
MIRRLFIAAALVALLAPATAARAVETLPTSPLVIVTADGAEHAFIVEVADEDSERARGLMFRESLPGDRGMLFDYKRPRRVAMWMKNTLIPLDMLFIRADGTIANIRERAVPRSLQTIPSKGRVRAVLELAGGTVDRLGIAPGDAVRHAIFERD